jgi:hypothetical protein
MDGQVHAKRCCAAKKSSSSDGASKVERDMRCCQVDASQTASVPATTAANGGWEPSPFAAVSVIIELPTPPVPRTHDRVAFVRARGPPQRTGPQLFVRNCAFLI